MSSKQEPADAPDELVPDAQMRKEFNVSAMTVHRWDNDPDLQFPPPVKIRKHNFRSRHALEAFKKRVIATALKEQRKRLAKVSK